MSSELAIVYASLILADAEVAITPENLSAVTKAAGIEVEAIWTKVFAQALANTDVNGLLSKIGAGSAAPAGAAAAAPAAGSAAPAAAEAEPEPESEEDDDMGFGLFD
ncbi:hypothetical protein H9P43_005465 [Blastocladiella emersonii ATCC 22665]|nr:hypothetical protein H9P43_005465 [Blastocladiella emersonii ATCC 22665]